MMERLGRSWGGAGWGGQLTKLLSLGLVMLAISCGDSTLRSRQEGSEPAVSWLNRHELIDRIKLYQSHIDAATAARRRVREHNYLLQRFLLGGVDQGCFLARPLGVVTIRITGHEEESALLAQHRDPDYMMDTGDPGALHFEFAGDLGVNISGDDLLQHGEVQTPRLRHHQVKDLRYLKITKLGKGIRSYSNTTRRGCGFLWLGPCPRYNFFEEKIWDIQQLEIWSDRLLIYREKLAHKFTAAAPAWSDETLLDNSSYRALISRDDCRVVQHVVAP